MLQDKYGMQKARLSLADDPLTPQAKLGKPTPELNTANTHQIRWVFAEACAHTLHKSCSQYLTLEGQGIVPRGITTNTVMHTSARIETTQLIAHENASQKTTVIAKALSVACASACLWPSHRHYPASPVQPQLASASAASRGTHRRTPQHHRWLRQRMDNKGPEVHACPNVD